MTNNEKKYCVYKHTSPGGKVYIGITCQNPPTKRWQNGIGYKNNKYFQRAIKKYGWNNFEHKILFDNLSFAEAESKEIELIKLYDSTNPKNGYNISTGGKGREGVPLSQEAKDKISKANKGRSPSEEQKQKQREKMSGENNPFYGKTHSKEVREKIKEKQKEVWKDPNYRKKMSEKRKQESAGENNSMYGKHHSEKTKAKISLALQNPVIQFDKNGNFLAEYIGSKEAERVTGVKSDYITRCCRGVSKTAGGFIWRYKENESD